MDMERTIQTHTIILDIGVQFDITFDGIRYGIDYCYYELNGKTVARIRPEHIIVEMEVNR